MGLPIAPFASVTVIVLGFSVTRESWRTKNAIREFEPEGSGDRARRLKLHVGPIASQHEVRSGSNFAARLRSGKRPFSARPSRSPWGC